MGARILVIDDSPTLRKVVGAILSRYQYEPLAAADGQAGLELLASEKIDLVLLDFVMPRMNGYQFCRELRARPGFRGLPVVLMSAKAERIRDQFLQQTGAVDAITKPFDGRALIAVVEAALQKAEAGRVPQAPEPTTMVDTLQEPESIRPSALRIEDARKVSRARAEIGDLLAQVVFKALKNSTADGALEQQNISDAIAGTLDEAAMTELAAQLANLRIVHGTADALSGDIAAIPLGEILQVLQMQRQTGVLDVTDGKVEVLIVLRDGFIDFAQAKNASPEFRLGRYFIESGLMTAAQLEQAVREASESKRLLGDMVLQSGLVSEDDLRKALIRQTSEVIYDVLRRQKGRFVLTRDSPLPEAASARLGLPVASIVMEGFRRVDEWRLIEESIHFDEVLVRNEPAIGTLRAEEFTRQERALLDAVDGHRTVREIIDETHQSSFDTCKTFYRLLQSRLVRRRASA